MFGCLSSIQWSLTEAASKLAEVCRQRWEPSLFVSKLADTNTAKWWKDVFKVISHFSSPSLFSYSPCILLPQTASCRDALACGERSHVEKRRSARSSIGKWLAARRAQPGPVYLDEVSPLYLISLQLWTRPSTPSIIHSVCMCDFFFSVFFRAGVQTCYREAQLGLLPSSLLGPVWLSSVRLTCLKSIAIQQRGEGGRGAMQPSTTNYHERENIHKYVHA